MRNHKQIRFQRHIEPQTSIGKYHAMVNRVCLFVRLQKEKKI